MAYYSITWSLLKCRYDSVHDLSGDYNCQFYESREAVVRVKMIDRNELENHFNWHPRHNCASKWQSVSSAACMMELDRIEKWIANEVQHYCLKQYVIEIGLETLGLR